MITPTLAALALTLPGPGPCIVLAPEPAAVAAHAKLHAWLDTHRPGWDTARDEAGARHDDYGTWRNTK